MATAHVMSTSLHSSYKRNRTTNACMHINLQSGSRRSDHDWFFFFLLFLCILLLLSTGQMQYLLILDCWKLSCSENVVHYSLSIWVCKINAYQFMLWFGAAMANFIIEENNTLTCSLL